MREYDELKGARRIMWAIIKSTKKFFYEKRFKRKIR